MVDFEKLGVLYLGRAVGADGKTGGDLVLYDSTDLVTHAVCVGMTGSGKTGLCIDLLEEAAIDGVPAILIDPKGDLGNLLLTFPDLAPADFAPWVDPGAAARAGVDVDTFAAQEAERWKEGLASWGQDGERIRRLRAAADFAIYTPGSDAGRPLSVLGSLAPPADGDDAEGLRDAIASTATGLLALVGIAGDPVQSREHILLATILQDAWTKGQSLDLPTLIARIPDPGTTRVGVLDLESFFPAKDRFGLAMAVNNLLAAPGFDLWLRGDPIDVQALLYGEGGRPRISIVSIAHLSDSERMFVVTLLLQAVVGWVRRQSGTTSLRAVLYLDEVYGFAPPVAEPPSKRPLLTLMKQARAAGLGVVLATQNPVDLDYKGLANAGTWLIGRLQTERDRERLLDGLESAQAGGGFDRAAASTAIAGLDKRQFLLHDVHEDGPVVLSSRWAMSYLAGPLTRDQIRRLTPADAAPTPATQAATAPAPSATAPAPSANGGPPALPPDVPRCFLPVRRPAPAGSSLHYAPALLGTAAVRFQRATVDVDHAIDVAYLAPLADGPATVDWAAASPAGVANGDVAATAAEGAATYGDPPAAAAQPKRYAAWQREFVTWLTQSQEVTVLRSRRLKLVSRSDEDEAAFRLRVGQALREERDAAVAKVRQKFAPKVAALEERIRRADQAVQREQDQAQGAGMDAAISLGATVLGAIFGRRKASASSASSVLRGAGRQRDQQADVERAQETATALRQSLANLQAEFATTVGELDTRMDPNLEELEPVTIRPRKTDVDVGLLALAFAPHWRDATGRLEPAWTV